jgi:hypothetical protein
VILEDLLPRYSSEVEEAVMGDPGRLVAVQDLGAKALRPRRLGDLCCPCPIVNCFLLK